MPISLELVNFTEVFKIYETKKIAESFERLGQWLKARVTQAEELERSSARLPVVRFYNGAVTLFIDSSQHDALAPPEAPPSFGEHLRAGGRRLAAGLEDAVNLPRETLILPRFLDTLVEALDAVLASVGRFQEPSADLFDVKARSAGDLFGEAALGFRALSFGRGQLLGFRDVLADLKGPAAEGGPMASAADLPDLLERATRFLVAGLYLVTTLPELVGRLWTEGSLSLRARILDVLAGVEESAFGLRRKVIDLFYVDLRGLLRKALGFAQAWQEVVTGWLGVTLEAGALFSKQLVDQLGRWFAQLADFALRVVDLVRALLVLLDALAAIDLMPLLVDLLGKKGWAAKTLASPPSVTIGDLADPATRSAAHGRLESWLGKVVSRASTGAGLLSGGLLGPLGGLVGKYGSKWYLNRKLRPVRHVLDLLLDSTAPVPAETGAFTGPLPAVPDLYAAFTTGLEPLRAATAGFTDALNAQVAGLLDRAGGALEQVAGRFRYAALLALKQPDAAAYLGISDEAARRAGALFPPGDATGTAPDGALVDLAASFDAWAAEGGIDVVAAVLPRYLGAMRAFWAERAAAGEEATVCLPEELPPDFPTSPHVMALHPTLARTLVPRMTVGARGRPLDAALADRVADAFLGQVQAAHQAGLAKLAALQAAAGG